MDADGLRRLAGRWRIPLGVVEKDHAITVVLGVLASLPCAKELAFKGGTALRKVYFEEHRFSEDLDFTASSDVSSALLGSEESFLDAGRRSSVGFTGIGILSSSQDSRRLRIRYADMNGHENSIRLELSLREQAALPTHHRPILDPYGVLDGNPRIWTMALPEILSEKVRTLHMRRQPRDLYDLWVLLKKGVRIDLGLIRQKLGWWQQGIAFDSEDFFRRIVQIEPVWERDLGALIPEVPSFTGVVSDVKAGFKGLSR